METRELKKEPYFIICPSKGWAPLELRELWSYRELLFVLGAKEIKLRYKQTVLGVAWVVLQPLVSAMIFAVIFGRFAKLPSDGQPYLLFALCGLLPWNLFSGILQRGGASLISNANLISKIYFPRLLIPLSNAWAVFVDFIISLAILGVFMVFYGILPGPRALLLPFFIALCLLAGVGASLWIAALNVKYRDFMYALPFLLQVWMYATPVAYAASIVPEQWRLLLSLNPAVTFIEGFRWSLLGTGSLSLEMTLVSAAASLILFISGSLFFKRVERGLADAI